MGLERWRLPNRVTLMPRICPSGRSGTLTLRITGPSSAPCSGSVRHALHQLRGHLRGAGKIAGAIRRQAQGNGNGRQPKKSAFDCRGHRARVQRVVAKIGAVVDARHHNVVLEIEQAGDRQMHAVGGRAVDIVRIGVVARGAHRHIQRQRIARTAAVSIRCDDGDGAQGLDRKTKRRQALGSIAVVIGKQNLHRLTACAVLAGVAVRTIL